MKKIIFRGVFLIALFAFAVPVFAVFVVTNEVKMLGYGSSTNTIGGEAFPANYKVMIDKRLMTGNVSVSAVVREKINIFKTEEYGVNWNFVYGRDADGRYTYNATGRPQKSTTIYWQKRDYTANSVYVVGSYQY